MEVALFVKEEAEVHHGGPGVVVVEEVQQQQAQESLFKLKKNVD